VGNISDNFVQEIKTRILCPLTFFRRVSKIANSQY